MVARVAAALTLLWSVDAAALSWLGDEPKALPCRPTIACTADVVPAGSVEIEVGYLFRRLQSPILQHSLPILAKLSLADWVQLQIGGNGPTFANAPVPTRYLDDLVAGLKMHVADQSRFVPSLSWSLALSVPLAAATGFVRTYDLFWTLYVTKDFAWLHADLNVGLDFWQLEGPTRTQPWAALALSVDLPRRFTAMAESYYFFDAPPIAPHDGGVLAALAYAPRPWIVFDVGADAGLVQSQRSVSVFAGATVLPVTLWRRSR